jgi:hypothetical protein
VGPRAGLDVEVIGKILCLCRGSNPGRPVRSQTRHKSSHKSRHDRENLTFARTCLASFCELCAEGQCRIRQLGTSLGFIYSVSRFTYHSSSGTAVSGIAQNVLCVLSA